MRAIKHLSRPARIATVMALTAVFVVTGCEANTPLPTEKAQAVVEKFYEFISQARLRGGTLLIREAYKLIDSERSKLSESKFIQIVQKYPPGFSVKVVNEEIAERQAKVTIEYKVSSMFGEGFLVRNITPLNVDEATNTWKIDFTGETDAQSLAVVKDSN